MRITEIEPIEIRLPKSRTVAGGETLGFHRTRANFLANPLTKPESTEGRPWGQPLKKPAGAPLNLG